MYSGGGGGSVRIELLGSVAPAGASEGVGSCTGVWGRHLLAIPYLHAGSVGGGGGSVVGFSAWRFLYRGWGGLDAGDEEDWRAGAAWPAPASKKRGVRPQLRTITTIRYRFHLKPLCEESFFGLGSVLAPWCSGDRLVDGLVKMAAFPVSTGDPWDLLVFCCFSRVIYVVWLQSLYPPYPLRRRLYWYVFMDVFLTV